MERAEDEWERGRGVRGEKKRGEVLKGGGVVGRKTGPTFPGACGHH